MSEVLNDKSANGDVIFNEITSSGKFRVIVYLSPGEDTDRITVYHLEELLALLKNIGMRSMLALAEAVVREEGMKNSMDNPTKVIVH